MAPDPEPADRGRARADALAALRRLARLDPEHPDREHLREEVITGYMSYARHLAGRFGVRGEAAEDLTQAAYMGLVKAVDNYDPAYETTFLTYATPMITGEIKRHFRDTTWDVHVPRRIQELSGALRPTAEALTQELGRSPDVAELAERLNTTPEEIVDAMDAASAHNAASLDVSVELGDDTGTTLGDLLGDDDPALELVVDREALRPLLTELGDRDKRILLMRYFRNMTQSEIGEQLGVSQVQVSRLLSAILERLRARLGVAVEP
jgi:RNA polymerase sigma-B factor